MLAENTQNIIDRYQNVRAISSGKKVFDDNRKNVKNKIPNTIYSEPLKNMVALLPKLLRFKYRKVEPIIEIIIEAMIRKISIIIIHQ
jgi:hypothetical protein